MDSGSEKRVERAVAMARACFEKPELASIYLRRFHRAMDDLRSQAEGEAVYERCQAEGWYQSSLSRSRPVGPGILGASR